jgi:hypothetical protein
MSPTQPNLLSRLRNLWRKTVEKTVFLFMAIPTPDG